jgi:2-polyprenyl-3-methyl-5-hydroxy-6-metoxy-1,4-benzoquinol methylase
MRTFLAALVVLPYDQRVAIRWGEIQAYAQLRGRPRPANDSWIAACCLAREQPLATFNIKDYIDFVEHDAVGAGPNTRVLDVACGQGYLAARAVERGATAVEDVPS